MISIITCMSMPTRVIGKDGGIPWYLPKDFEWFKRTTFKKPCIMGRRTWESLPDNVRPLPERMNIVVSTNLDYLDQITDHNIESPVIGCDSLQRAITCAEVEGKSWNPDNKEIIILGGGIIYKEALDIDIVDRIYMTQIQQPIEGDTFFPQINLLDWTWSMFDYGQHQDLNYHIYVYDRRRT